MIDQEISHYRILRPLGRGGMATVYLAEQLGLRRQVALKILHSHLAADETIVERFLREARIAASLQHQRIVTIYDVGEERGVYYIAMRYIDGESFGQLLRREGPLAPARALDLLQQIADALDFAHTHGVLHRDVKPANVMVEPGDVLTLTDFGIARAGHQSGLTAAHTVIGTPAYMSPEQARGAPVDERSDLYALGIMLYEALGGRPPFRADNTTALLFMHVHQAPPPLQEIRPELPPALCAVVARALAKSPDERFQSGRAMIAAARRALAGQPDDTGEGATLMVGASQVASPASAPPASAQYADWPSGPPSGPVVAPFGAAPLTLPASVGMAAPAVAPVVAPTAYYSTAEPYQATLTPAPVPYGPPPGRPAGAATTTP